VSDDQQSFRDAMRGVKPIKASNRIVKPKQTGAPRAHKRRADDQSVVNELLDQDPLRSDLQSGEEFEYCRDGYDSKILRRLRRGDFRVEAELDLHGQRLESARSALQSFIARCVREDIRCVRIIHGKGLRSPNKEPVLKYHAQQWLTRINAVHAACTTPPSDGGTGAVYVLLKKRSV